MVRSGPWRFAETGLWADVRGLPAALGDTVAAREGVAAAARLLGGGGVERIVATGNGAAFYVAQALWLAALESAPRRAAGGRRARAASRRGTGSAWRPGDALLAVSSSGEFRDVVEIARRPGAPPCVAITASPDSSLARAASAVVVQRVASQRAVTHTQAVAGAYALRPRRLGGGERRRGAGRAASTPPRRGRRSRAGGRGVGGGGARTSRGSPAAAVAMGGGPRWAAALELALMLKEISRVPAEGVETREGATSAMFGLAPGHLDALARPGRRSRRRRGRAPVRRHRRDRPAACPSRRARTPGSRPITTLPAAAALSAGLALAAGHDVDEPAWTAAYYATAR